MAETNKQKSGGRGSTRCLAEGGICVALAIGLSFIKIPIGLAFGGFGGSIDLVMIPLIIYAVRWGLGYGVAAGFIFGLLKYFLGGGSAVNWISMLLDYSVAYAFVGFAGLLRGANDEGWTLALPVGALLGCFGRFVIHFISGVTVYAEYMPEEFMNVTHLTPALYSLLYNGTYMLPNTILAIIACALLALPLKKLKK